MSDSQHLTTPAKARETLQRPKLAVWLWDRGLSYTDVAEPFGVSREWVRLLCLPFGDPRRRIPAEETLQRIFDYTAGAIAPEDFYPEHLRRPRAEPTEHAA